MPAALPEAARLPRTYDSGGAKTFRSGVMNPLPWEKGSNRRSIARAMLSVFLQAERAPGGNGTETAFGKIPAAKHFPGTAGRGCEKLFAEELYLDEIGRVRLIVPSLCVPQV